MVGTDGQRPGEVKDQKCSVRQNWDGARAEDTRGWTSDTGGSSNALLRTETLGALERFETGEGHGLV